MICSKRTARRTSRVVLVMGKESRSDMTRRVLCIDGGGIKGVFPASFLSTIEESVSSPAADYFDLIVGTSTGGIIALGLGLGLRASNLLRFYEEHGPTIFKGNGKIGFLRHLFRAKYTPEPLRKCLSQAFGSRRLGDSRKRLVIPSFNVDTGEVHVWKTAHNSRLERDYLHSAVEVALSTAAAPTYFPTYKAQSGTPLIDGGVWANNPVAIATVEAIGILGWQASELRILSLGCTTAPFDIDWGRRHSLGMLGWAKKITDLFMTAQSASAIGMTQHLLPDRNNLVRISPMAGKNRFDLDRVAEIPSLKGLGDFEARKALPLLRAMFFNAPVQEDFVPCHPLRELNKEVA
jgi:predicted acylesterase/phospholipase RssA